MSKLQDTNNLIGAFVKQAKEEGEDSIIVMCSLGKDSLVALDLLYGKFERVVCVFMYFVKDLEHINRWVNFVKTRYPLIDFVQVPHWNLSYILRYGTYCVAKPNIKLIKLSDVVKALRLKYNTKYVVLGMKKADGMNRNLMLRGYADNGYVNNGMFYPLAEWTQKEVLSYMKHRRLPQPVRYSLAASSGVGFNDECFLWLEKHFPSDLKKIYKVFPLSERILFHAHRKEREDFIKTKCKTE